MCAFDPPAGLLTLKKASPSDMRSRRLKCSSRPTRKTLFPNECQALASRSGLESKTSFAEQKTKTFVDLRPVLTNRLDRACAELAYQRTRG